MRAGKTMNIAVTGVGGFPGQSILKALQETEYNIIGIDGDELGAGLFSTSRSYVGYYANHPKFIDRLIEICSNENCRLIFPGLDCELIPLSHNIKKFKENNIFPVVSNPQVIKICDDKFETTKFLKNNNLPYLETYLLKDYNSELNFPVVLKPKKGGTGSVRTYIVENRKEFDSYSEIIDKDNCIVQEYVEGDEYTCGTVSFENGCVGVILLRRQLKLRLGFTWRAFVVKDVELSHFVKNVINILKPFGACNVQLRIRNGTPYIFEFNARCSGTTSSRASAGFNEPKMVCDYLLKGNKNPSYEIKEIAILRYLNELLVDIEKIKEIKLKNLLYHKGAKL